MTVGIRELKNRLSEYIRLVKTGQRILITDRGEVVAELRLPGPEHELPYPGLRDLARQGKLRVGLGNRPELYPQRPVITPEGTAQRLLDADRGER